jgi:hypothetical protein
MAPFRAERVSSAAPSWDSATARCSWPADAASTALRAPGPRPPAGRYQLAPCARGSLPGQVPHLFPRGRPRRPDRRRRPRRLQGQLADQAGEDHRGPGGSPGAGRGLPGRCGRAAGTACAVRAGCGSRPARSPASRSSRWSCRGRTPPAAAAVARGAGRQRRQRAGPAGGGEHVPADRRPDPGRRGNCPRAGPRQGSGGADGNSGRSAGGLPAAVEPQARRAGTSSSLASRSASMFWPVLYSSRRDSRRVARRSCMGQAPRSVVAIRSFRA